MCNLTSSGTNNVVPFASTVTVPPDGLASMVTPSTGIGTDFNVQQQSATDRIAVTQVGSTTYAGGPLMANMPIFYSKYRIRGARITIVHVPQASADLMPPVYMTLMGTADTVLVNNTYPNPGITPPGILAPNSFSWPQSEYHLNAKTRMSRSYIGSGTTKLTRISKYFSVAQLLGSKSFWKDDDYYGGCAFTSSANMYTAPNADITAGTPGTAAFEQANKQAFVGFFVSSIGGRVFPSTANGGLGDFQVSVDWDIDFFEPVDTSAYLQPL